MIWTVLLISISIDLRNYIFYNKRMKLQQLDAFLRQITPSEQYHLDHPGKLSRRYDFIPATRVGGNVMYEFSFDSVLKNENISIMKESRFTEIPLHHHKVIEINYIYSGQCTQIINGQKITLHTGDVCLLDRNTPHAILDIGADDIIITIDMRKKYFTDGFLQRLSTQGIVSKFLVNALQDNTNEKQFILFGTENSEELRWPLESMLCEYFNEDKSSEIIDAYMIIILAKLLKIYQQNHLANYKIDKSILILDILQYLEINYLTTNLCEAANHFNFNPTYFGNYIKKHTGKTFKELIIQKKLSASCYYLVNTNQPIYKIANEAGYENLGFFYKKFKEKYGVTPQEYRQQHFNC